MQITKPSDLARAVKSRRQKLGLTQQEVAEGAGITRQSLARVERGIGAPSFDTVLRIFDQLGLTLDASAPEHEDEGGAGTARPSRTAVAAARTVFTRDVPALDGWQKGLADTLHRARPAGAVSDTETADRVARVAALDAALRAGDPDRPTDDG